MNFITAINRLLANKYLAFAVTLFILIACSWPGKEMPPVFGFHDKIAHFLAFGVWAFCWQAAFGRYRQTLIAGILYGIFIEIVQGYILPESFHRSFDWYDALADSIGVLMGLGAWKTKHLLHL